MRAPRTVCGYERVAELARIEARRSTGKSLGHWRARTENRDRISPV
jgi:hypothetical protein